MKQFLLLIFCFSIFVTAYSQDIKRVEVEGKIVVASDELEGITAYNTSSNKGAITDAEGKFKIEVGLNDIVEFRALQFQDFTITIDKNIIASKKMTVFLAEKINKLDEVVILPYDLTGNLLVDMESVRTFNPDLDAIYFGIGDSSAYEFPDDYKSEVDNIAMPGSGQDIRYGLNVISIVGVLLKPLFKSNKNEQDKVPDVPTTGLRDYYSSRYIVDNFAIPEEKVNNFIGYVEANGLDYSLLEKGKEMEFLEFLTQKSKEFLKVQSGKN